MAMQDISSKVMLYHNDVFSDIINGLLFERKYIDENKLKDVIPESAYEDFDGNLRSMERDLLKEYGEGDGTNYFAIAEFGIGNQTTVAQWRKAKSQEIFETEVLGVALA